MEKVQYNYKRVKPQTLLYIKGTTKRENMPETSCKTAFRMRQKRKNTPKQGLQSNMRAHVYVQCTCLM